MNSYSRRSILWYILLQTVWIFCISPTVYNQLHLKVGCRGSNLQNYVIYDREKSDQQTTWDKDSKTKANCNEYITKRGDSGNGWDPGQFVKVRNLRQENLQYPKTDHVGIIRSAAISFKSISMDANNFVYFSAILHLLVRIYWQFLKLDKHQNTNTNIRQKLFANNVSYWQINLTMIYFYFFLYHVTYISIM